MVHFSRIVPLVASLCAALSIARPSVASLPEAGVVAVGGGVAIVEHDGFFSVFSLEDGAPRGRVKLTLPIYDVRFDSRRSEFWGESWQQSPVVWSWRPGEAFRVEKIPVSWIYKAFAPRNGERVLAVTVSTAARDEDVHRSRIALAKWDGQRLRFIGAALPYEAENTEGRFVVMGSLALHSGFVDPETGRPVTPNVRPFSKEDGFFVWGPSPDRWVMVESDSGRILESRDDGRSWTSRTALTGETPPGTFFGLEGDPYRAGVAYALLRIEREEESALELFRCRAADLDCRSIWRGPAETSEGKEPAGDMVFDTETVWIQRTFVHSDGKRSIHLTGISTGEDSRAPRELVLEVTPKGPPAVSTGNAE